MSIFLTGKNWMGLFKTRFFFFPEIRCCFFWLWTDLFLTLDRTKYFFNVFWDCVSIFLYQKISFFVPDHVSFYVIFVLRLDRFVPNVYVCCWFCLNLFPRTHENFWSKQMTACFPPNSRKLLVQTSVQAHIECFWNITCVLELWAYLHI